MTYSGPLRDLVRVCSRPTQDSLEAAAIAVRTPGAAPRTLFKKPNRLPRKTREAIKAAQIPNKENVWMDPDKAKRDQMFDDLRASGVRPTKSSTSINGVNAWVVSWSK